MRYISNVLPPILCGFHSPVQFFGEHTKVEYIYIYISGKSIVVIKYDFRLWILSYSSSEEYLVVRRGQLTTLKPT